MMVHSSKALSISVLRDLINRRSPSKELLNFEKIELALIPDNRTTC
ncbi:hypothetical protein [Calothrix sp. 336/3]|nr:hypothetical protein [Calothrix sp. 336/3]